MLIVRCVDGVVEFVDDGDLELSFDSGRLHVQRGGRHLAIFSAGYWLRIDFPGVGS